MTASFEANANQAERPIQNYMADNLKKIIEVAIEGLRKDIKEVGVKVEAVQSDLSQVLEGVETHNQQLERLDATLETVRDDVEAIKVTLKGQKRWIRVLEAKEAR
jgi:archaellum component FlaC